MKVGIEVMPCPYYLLGTIRTVPRVYDSFNAYEVMKKNEKLENLIQNNTQDFRNIFFQKTKLHCKPTCEVQVCEKSTFLSLCLG
jgi:hypothetical protein